MTENLPDNPCKHSFVLPYLLVSLSVVGFLGWQVLTAIQQRNLLRRLYDQQVLLVNQATQVEGAFKAMLTELVALSATDPDAQALVSKYRISLNPSTP